MDDLNAAAPSSTEPAAAGATVNATEVQTRAQEAGGATAGELGQSSSDQLQSRSPSYAEDMASVLNASDTGSSGIPAVTAQEFGLTNDAPAVAASGEASATSDANASAPESSKPLQANSDADAQRAGEADAGNAGVSPAAGQSASDTASSAQGASQGGDTAADALRAELDAAHARIAALEQQVTDEQERVIKWQGLYNAATATRLPEAAPTARRWLDVLERKVASLEHDARAELLDVARQLREAL